MTIQEAAKRGIKNIYLKEWALPEDHFELHLTGDGGYGPWATFVSPLNEVVGNPTQIFVGQLRGQDWLEWVPPTREQGKGKTE